MTSSEQQRLEEERLQAEIVGLRSDLGETVEALVHKADLPARAKERGNELKAEAIELQEQVVDRTVELSGRAIERGNEWKAQVVEHGSELRGRAIDAAERTREAVSQTPTDRWAKLAAAGIALVTVLVIVRRVRRS
jgi:hypothetical protein